MADHSLFTYTDCNYRRLPTRAVRVGPVTIGGGHPIRVQSMVNTAPEEIAGTIRQSIALAEAGCELIRLTVPAVQDAYRLQEVKDALVKAGIDVPLVADVHFNPQIAEICAGYFDKVRINPGNYRKLGVATPTRWTEEAYHEELKATEELIVRLIEACRPGSTAIRVGSNHGSLSPRILDRYGDTPQGMVEAAMEFVRIFSRHGFHDLVLSMKSSNVRVMVHAYRLLVSRMAEEGYMYPLHLGVTEAGFGDEGRIKSAAGIGVLLDEGIGDTIRVSLTEDPVAEIPVARKMLERYGRFGKSLATSFETLQLPLPFDPFHYSRRVTIPLAGAGNGAPPVVIGDQTKDEAYQPDLLTSRLPSDDGTSSMAFIRVEDVIPVITAEELLLHNKPSEGTLAVLLPEIPDRKLLMHLKDSPPMLLVVGVNLFAPTGVLPSWVALMEEQGIRMPVVLKIDIKKEEQEEVLLNCAISASRLLTDGMADGIWLDGEHQKPGFLNSLAFRILQSTRARITAPEYISCPSCGRTRFNIQDAVHKIKARTSHLKGLKIGIMGCIVNGPGEMADADYGYVGAGNRKITLYKGKEVVKRGIPEEEAVEVLVELIKENGDWTEPL
ncbi:MAG: (E)-4-hydroxy-3-methylbut-2-enyl-diphosphate synthase [Bacteroidales bacterium]